MYEIYGMSKCSYCVKAKQTLTEKNIDYEYYELNKDYVIEQFQEIFPGVKKVPQIMHDGKWIGGYEDLVKYLNGEDKHESR